MTRIHLDKVAQDDLAALPHRLRRAAQDVLLDLLTDPVPPMAEPYAGIPAAYRLPAGDIVVYYRAIHDEIDVLRVRPNS